MITTQIVMPVLPTLTTGKDNTRSIGSSKPIMFSSKAAAATAVAYIRKERTESTRNCADSSFAGTRSAQRCSQMRSM